MSDGGQKKPAGQKTWGEKTRQEVWVGTIAQALNSPSYGATHFETSPLVLNKTKTGGMYDNLKDNEQN